MWVARPAITAPVSGTAAALAGAVATARAGSGACPHRRFDPEFINRIDRVAVARLDAAWLDTLPDIELGKLNQVRRCRARLDNGARQLSAAPTTTASAPDLARRLRAELEPALARALLERPADDTFLALLDGDRLSVVPVNR